MSSNSVELCKCGSENQLDKYCSYCNGDMVPNPFNGTFELTRKLYTASQIAKRVKELGEFIDLIYYSPVEHNLVLLGALTGAFIFLADLSRVVKTPHRVEMVRASSYHGGTETSGSVQVEGNLDAHNLAGTDVLVVEDILDTGLTYQALRKALLEQAKVRSVRFCALLSKPEKLTVQDLGIDDKLIGFQMSPPRFVVGYGLDYKGYFRQLPFVAEAKETSR